MKPIPWELHNRLVVTDMDKKKLKKVVKNEQIVRRRVWKLKKKNMKARFQERVKELVDVCRVFVVLNLNLNLLLKIDATCSIDRIIKFGCNLIARKDWLLLRYFNPRTF